MGRLETELEAEKVKRGETNKALQTVGGLRGPGPRPRPVARRDCAVEERS